MNKKAIIGIICFLIAVCVAVGISQHLKSRNSNEENISSSFEAEKENNSGSDYSDNDNLNSASQGNAENQSNEENTTADNSNEESATKSNLKATNKNNETVTSKAENPTIKNSTQPTSKKATTDNTQKATDKGNNDTVTEKATEKSTINITFSINCKNAVKYGADVPDYLIYPASYKAEKGTTAFDALEAMCNANNLELKYKSKSYIQSIGNLAEKDCGSASGWMYTVNGTKPNTPSVKYVLNDGDVLEWYYVTSAND